MQKKTLTCFVIICLCFIKISLVSGQNFQWAYANGTSIPGDEGRSIVVDDSGNVYTAGYFSQDIAIFKNDAMGNLVWWDMLTGFIDASSTTPAMTIDNDGNLYLTGYFQNYMDFDPGPLSYLMSAPNGGAAYILKLNRSGTFIWAKMISGSSAIVKGTDIQFSTNGFIVLSGICTGSFDYDPGVGVSNSTYSGGNADAFVVKLDTAGNFIWGAEFGGTNICYSFGMSLDASDNVIMSGYFADTVDFDPGPAVYTLLASQGTNTYISKLDSSGNFIWARSIGDISSVICFGVDVDPSGNVYACGYFSDSCDFDPGAGVFIGVSNGGSDCYLVKLDDNGNFAWVATFGGTTLDQAHGVTYCDQGAVITTGRFAFTADFDPGPGTFMLGTPGVSQTFFIESLDVNGNFVSAKAIGGGGEGGNAVITDSIGNIYVTGYFQDTVDFNPPFQYNLISYGAGDIFTMKYGPLNVGVDEVHGDSDFNVFPNPSNDNFTFEFDDFYSGEYVVSNLLGEQIKTISFENSKILQCEIDCAAGIYFVNVTAGNKSFNSKLVKN